MPCEFTRRISTGIRPKSAGDAGDAKCAITSNFPCTGKASDRLPSDTSAETKLNRGSLARCAMLSVVPVTLLSTATTSQPRAKNPSTRWLPTNPPPPVTNTR